LLDVCTYITYINNVVNHISKSIKKIENNKRPLRGYQQYAMAGRARQAEVISPQRKATGRIMNTQKIKKLLPELEAARLDGDIIKAIEIQRAIMRLIDEKN